MKIGTICLLVMLSSLVFASSLVADEDESDAIYISYLPIISQPLKYFDDFSDPSSGWDVADDIQVNWSYQNGEYEILIREQIDWAGALAPVGGLAGYIAEAKMRRLSGSESDYGLIFDFQDWDNFYYFIVDPGDQWYGVGKFVNGVNEVAVPRTDSSLISSNNNMNHLKVEKFGDQFHLYVNNHHLKSASDAGFGGGEVGLYMESDGDYPASVRYDNFFVLGTRNGLSTTAGLRSRSAGIPARGSGQLTGHGP